ncbi:MAG: cytidine deaminase [Chloroflexota bacterium]|nr:cytidine deaminase [Chloroflexota bacterium]
MTEAAIRAVEAPFPADGVFALRMASLGATVGAAVAADLRTLLAGAPGDPRDASVIPSAAAGALVARHDLASIDELALLALPVAAELARPAISGYRVAAVGIEAESGDLVLGGNLEFPGSELGTTIHAEGFVALRARRRGARVGTLAVGEAHPCAHCRQTLSEAAGAEALRIIDPLGHALTLADLYPWPFTPTALGMDADSPTRVPWPDLMFAGAEPPAPIAAELLDLGRRAHAPYSGAPSAVVLALQPTGSVGAGCVESVAFNPSIGALQAALVELAAARIDAAHIAEGWLAKLDGGAIDPEPAFQALLRAVAPGASANVVRWRTHG